MILTVAAHHARLANPAVGWTMLAGFAVVIWWAVRSRRRR
jgi:uncharacterized protein (TIGR03382 family)